MEGSFKNPLDANSEEVYHASTWILGQIVFSMRSADGLSCHADNTPWSSVFQRFQRFNLRVNIV